MDTRGPVRAPGPLALACFIDMSRRYYVAGLIAPAAIDLDRIPPHLGLVTRISARHIPLSP